MCSSGVNNEPDSVYAVAMETHTGWQGKNTMFWTWVQRRDHRPLGVSRAAKMGVCALGREGEAGPSVCSRSDLLVPAGVNTQKYPLLPH